MGKSRGVRAELVELLQSKHGIKLSESDLIAVDNWKLQFLRPQRYADHPVPAVMGRGFFGFVGGLIAVGVAALVTGGLALPVASLAFAIGSTVFGLIGALIFKQRQRENESFAPLATISSGAPLARIGDSAPIVYCNRSPQDPAGGVRVESPPLIFSEVRSVDGLQQLKLVYLISVGEIGQISLEPNDILIDDQPINEVLLEGEYQVVSTLGRDNETQVIAPYSSQSIQVSVTNEVGGRIAIRRDDIDSVSGSTITFAEEGSLSSVSPSDRLSLSDDPMEEDPFRLINRNRTARTATFSKAVNKRQNIWAVSSFVYRASRPIDRLTINLNIVLWERTEEGDFKERVTIFDLYFTGADNNRVKVGRFGVRGRNPNGVTRSFEIRGIGRERCKIELIPRLKPGTSETIYTIGETGTFSNHDINGFTVAFQKESDITSGEISRLNTISSKSQYSFESQYPVTVQSVNEIVTDGAKSYPGFSVFSLLVDANERVNREPRVSILVKQGRKIRNLLAAGSATANGTNTLHAVTHDFTGQADPVVIGDMVRNLTTGEESTVTAVTQLSLNVDSATFNQGDRFLVYRVAPTSLFSDIAIDLLTDERVRATAIIDADEAIGLELFVLARNWHIENGIYWNGIVSEKTTFGTWFAEQLGFVRCLPYTAAGQLGIIPDRDEEISGLYTPQNMLESDAFERSFLPLNDKPYNQVVLRYRDGSDRLFRVREVIVKTEDVDLGNEPPNEQVIEAEVITTLDKAVELAQFILQGQIHQDKQFSWATDIEGVGNVPGDAVLVGSTNICYDGASAGVITEVRDDGAFKGSLPIDAQFITIEDPQGISPIQLDLTLTAEGNGYFSVSGYSPAVGDRYITGNQVTNRIKTRITEMQASPQDNKVSLSAILLPPELFGTDGLVTDFEPTAASLKWTFNANGTFQSYEGDFDTELEAISASAGGWRYNTTAGNCIQSSDGQYSTQSVCDLAWADGHFSCSLSATAPLTANGEGLLALLGAGDTYQNPQDIFVRLRYFNGSLEQSTAATTNREYDATFSQIVVSPTGFLTQNVLLDLTNRGVHPCFVQSGAKIRIWAEPCEVEVFIALGVPTAMLPDKYTDHTDWTSLGTHEFLTEGAHDFTATADFSAIKVLMTETGTEAQLQAIDVYDGTLIRAISNAIAPVPSVSVTQDPIVPPDTTGDVDVTATVPAETCGTFTQMDFTLYDSNEAIVGTTTTTGTYTASSTETVTFLSLPDDTYTATVVIRV